MVTCKSKNVYFAMDHTSTYAKDMQIMNNIQKKLEDAGFTVHRIDEPERGSDHGRGPNAMANQYSYMGRKGIKNSIVFNLMNGVDPSNILEAYQSDKSRGDGFWYSQQYLKPLGNVAVLGWFYGSYDPVNEENKDKSWTCWYTVRASETHGRIYNPRQLMDNNGVLCICDHNDYTGDSIANLFIKLVKENMGESSNDSSNNTSNTSGNTSTDDEIIENTESTDTTNTTNTDVGTLSTQNITEIYSKAYHQEVLTAKTGKDGTWRLPVELPIAGTYSVNLNFAGSKYYDGSTHTITIENHKGTVFVPKLLETTVVNTYSDGTSETTTTGSAEGHAHTLTKTIVRTYKDGLLTDEKVTTIDNDTVTVGTVDPEDNGLSTTTPVTTTNTTPTPTDTKNLFLEVVPLASDGRPDVAHMRNGDKKFAWVDTSKRYTLSFNDYKLVMTRDSKMCQLFNYVESKYTCFLSKETPNTYQVLERERWNTIEESIYYYLVRGDGKKNTLDSPPWPQEIIIDFPNQTTTCDGHKINWKKEKSTYWFVADNQDKRYTCGPTACSVCTQILHKYYSERYMQNLIGAIDGEGSGPSSHVKALKKLGFTAEIYSGFNNAVAWVKQNKPCVYHTDNHYTTLCDIADDGSILYSNSVQEDGRYGPLTGWRSSKQIRNKYWGSAVKVGLNWTISEEQRNNLYNFYHSMGGAWEKKPNKNESLRMFYLTY